MNESEEGGYGADRGKDYTKNSSTLTPARNRSMFPETSSAAHRMGEGRESKDERSNESRMASDLLILPLRLIRSAPGQKAEAKLVNSFHWECSQGRAAMRGHEVACLPGETGLHMGQSQRRASPFLAKSVLSAYFTTGLGGAYAVSVAPMALVLPAITSRKRFVRPTDEVPRRLDSGRVSVDYKSYTNGQLHASREPWAAPARRREVDDECVLGR